MKIKEVTVGKKMKIGLPNYSNIEAGCYIVFEVGEDEKVNWDNAWDIVNQQLAVQTGGIDPSWMQRKEYKNFFKVTIRQPKGGKE